MKNIIKTIVCFLVLVVLISSCRKKAFDAYYGAPADLAQPIYQILQAKGNFKSLLTCIDKAGYKDILSTAGYWTMFAADDSAFKVFLTGRGITDVAQLDSGTARQIVTYSLVYNAFMKARLGDYQSNTGWVPNTAFKRRTAYYTSYYTDSTPSKGYYSNVTAPVVALEANRNGAFVFGDNNNKYIPYFVDNFINTGSNGLSSADYNYFYPSTTYTGFNVADASVVNADITAQNGYVHEINKVVLPLPSIDEYLASNPQYSEFKKLYDKYMVSYIQNLSATNRYQTLSGLTNNVYLRMFNPALAYSPGNENYLKLQDNDGQANGWSMIAPTNAVLLNYVHTVLLEKYSSLDAMPPQIIQDFLNAHMWGTSLWPSKFSSIGNSSNETATMNKSTIVDKKVLSNGIFYGTSEVQQANVFRSVYGKAYLDPKYLLMTRLLDQNYRYSIVLPALRFVVLMMSDSALRARGYDYNVNYSSWQYITPGINPPPVATINPTMGNNLQRILAMHIVPIQAGEMDNISGSGIIETLNGEYIKWNGGNLSSAGTQDSNYVVHTTGTKTAFNGRVYYGDNLLIYSVNTIESAVKALGTPIASNFNYFWTYLLNSTLYSATAEMNGLTLAVNYTMFIPTNAAITQAVKDGVLPGTKATGVPTFTPTATSDQALVSSFIQAHILNKNTVVPDGKKSGTYETLYKGLSGNPSTFSITNSPNAMQITDPYGRTANVIVASSNNLANYCVIHLIDNYLKYNPN